MSNKQLAREITDFFIDYNMLEGETPDTVYNSVLNSLERNEKEDIDLILEYFKFANGLTETVGVKNKAFEIVNELNLRK